LPGSTDLSISADTLTVEAWKAACLACNVDSEDLARVVARHFRLPTADMSEADPAVVELVPHGIALKFGALPLGHGERTLILAVSDPTPPDLERELAFTSGRCVSFRIAPPSDIAKAIEVAYRPDWAATWLLEQVPGEVGDGVELGRQRMVEEITEAEIDSKPIVRLTKTVLQMAVEQNASDIHIQPSAGGGVVRFRVDGVLRTGMHMPLPITTRVISRIKVLGRLDIADRLRPQDGRAEIRVHERPYDLRISTVPTRRAEKAVIRILERRQELGLSEIGLSENEIRRMCEVLRQRDGLIVVTGPTGSGKSTTLHAALSHISSEDVNIVSVEDPVERELNGLTQVQVEESQGLTFLSALRAIMRQDPDVIVVGEVRDAETASIAARASLTGHLVLATLHTNEAIGVVRRLLDLGIDPSILVDTLRGSLAQRLVRTVCPNCVEPASDPLTEEERALFRRFQTRPTVRVVGCGECNHQGYKGRVPVVEFLVVSDTLAELILEGASPTELRSQAIADGMTPLLESALVRVRSGETTLQEVERVVGRMPPVDSVSAHPSTSTQPRDEDPRLAESTHATSRVLVVDDDVQHRVIVRSLLERAGYHVTESEDGSAGLARLARGEHFDLMLLDLSMPMLGGREVLAAVRRSVGASDLNVVVVTDAPDPDTELEMLQAGADAYVRKPIEARSLMEQIEAVLRSPPSQTSPSNQECPVVK
jgi:type IV pilus assembly protein PilB